MLVSESADGASHARDLMCRKIASRAWLAPTRMACSFYASLSTARAAL